MPIRIKSKQANFRRCGIAHPAVWMEYPDDYFTREELAVLKNEPMIIVERDPDTDETEAALADVSGKKPAKTGKKGK